MLFLIALALMITVPYYLFGTPQGLGYKKAMAALPTQYKDATKDGVAIGSQVDKGVVKTAHRDKAVVAEEVLATPAPLDPIQSYILEVFGKDGQDAIKIAKCESKLNPQAVGHNSDSVQSTDWGLFQINDHWQKISNPSFLLDYKINTLMAKKIFDSRGNWSAWTCATKWGALN